ncbi:MAG TPA: CGNR zinc finger domain-containing protein [Acetobacteraceae bacterium]|nr:CGNR zinc finger domain-containing protein [Acetobacteraceae bacterium]
MLVFMRLSEKYDVPKELALLYDFVNTLDRRRYVEQGVVHAGGDELATPRQMEAWMRGHHLAVRGRHIDAAEHRRALDLRSALRAFLELPPAERENTGAARQLSAAGKDYPLSVTVAGDGTVTLEAAPGSSALGRVLVELYGLAETYRLARLKACASEECYWIFFDRSKPANRHWCSSDLCGNRQKTRDYRRRQSLRVENDS